MSILIAVSTNSIKVKQNSPGDGGDLGGDLVMKGNIKQSIDDGFMPCQEFAVVQFAISEKLKNVLNFQARASVPRQNYYQRLGPMLSLKLPLRISPHPSLIFKEVINCQNLDHTVFQS